VNVSQLAAQAFDATSESTVPGVFVVGADGQRYFPRLESYDFATNQATFLMLDRLPNGLTELHLSGANGLAGYGGMPLVGNDPNDPAGDFVVRFTIADPTYSAGSNPLLRSEQEPNDTFASPQNLGVLFPRELHNGVTIAGTLEASTQDAAPDVDYYLIEALQSQEYHFTLTGPTLSPGGPTDAPAGAEMIITDAAGTAVQPLPQDNPNAIFADLAPGKYVIRVDRPKGTALDAAGYEIHITILNQPENPPPLTVGAAPALQIRLDVPPPPPTPPPTPLPTLLPVTVVQLPGGADIPATPVTSVVVVVANTTNKPLTAPTEPVSTPRLPVSTSLPVDLVQFLRGDLQGGVTGTTGTAILVVAPLQIRGLDSSSGQPKPGVVGVYSLLDELLSGTGAGTPLAFHLPEEWQWLHDLFFRGTNNLEPVPEPGPSNKSGPPKAAGQDWPVEAAASFLSAVGADLWATPPPDQAAWPFVTDPFESTGRSLVEWATQPCPTARSGSGHPNQLWGAAVVMVGFAGGRRENAPTPSNCKTDLRDRKPYGR
jgi:hypothetical protein